MKSVEIINLEAVGRSVDERLKKLRPAFKEAFDQEKNRIQARTQSGKDVNNRTFKKYSEKRRKQREEAGKQVKYVDLTFTGDMFNAFQSTFAENETSITGTMSFGNETWKVIKNEGYGRKFFGLSKEQVNIIIDKVRNAK